MKRQEPPSKWFDESHAIGRRDKLVCFRPAVFVVRAEIIALEPTPVVDGLGVGEGWGRPPAAPHAAPVFDGATIGDLTRVPNAAVAR